MREHEDSKRLYPTLAVSRDMTPKLAGLVFQCITIQAFVGRQMKDTKFRISLDWAMHRLPSDVVEGKGRSSEASLELMSIYVTSLAEN